jgi:hypothetical protein
MFEPNFRPDDYRPGATAVFRAEKKHRFRFSLPVEILLFGHLLILAVSGGFIPGGLFDTLQLHRANLHWFLMGSVVALWGLSAAVLELVAGARWDNAALRRSAAARLWANASAIVVWIYMVHLLATLRDPFGVLPLAMMGMLFVGFHGWAAVLCKRLYCILSPGFSTRRLEERLESNRLTVH